MEILDGLTNEQAIMLATLVVAILMLIVGILAWRYPRDRQASINIQSLIVINLHRVIESPVIHSTSGVPTLQQLTKCVEMNAKRRQLAHNMYGLGLEQFNHYVNNRDGIIGDARDTMNDLRGQLSEADLSFAEEIGAALATKVGDDLRKAQTQYDALSPHAQNYATSMRDEQRAFQSIARDHKKGVPRTDYTGVKSRIAAGDATLASITSELPIMWQGLLTLNERFEIIEPTGKPPKREYVHVMFLTRDRGVLEDKKRNGMASG